VTDPDDVEPHAAMRQTAREFQYVYLNLIEIDGEIELRQLMARLMDCASYSDVVVVCKLIMSTLHSTTPAAEGQDGSSGLFIAAC
jgi:hypothetical protein